MVLIEFIEGRVLVLASSGRPSKGGWNGQLALLPALGRVEDGWGRGIQARFPVEKVRGDCEPSLLRTVKRPGLSSLEPLTSSCVSGTV